MLEFKIHKHRVDATCGAETAQVCTEISEPPCPHGISQSTQHNRIYSYCVSHKRSSLVSQKAQEIILCFRRAAEYAVEIPSCLGLVLRTQQGGWGSLGSRHAWEPSKICILPTGRDLRLPRGAEPPSSKVCSTFLYSSCSELASSSGLLAEGASPTPHTSELLFTFKFPFFLFFCEDRFSSSLSKLCGGFSETQSCAFGSQPWLFQVSG